MQALLRDLRFGCRSLLRSPSVAIVATLALTVGIGLTTTMFSIVYGALMTDPPYPQGERVVSINRHHRNRGAEPLPLSIHDFADYRAAQQSFVDIGAFTSGTVYLSGDEKAERFDGTWVTANTFDILQIRPVLGRAFRTAEDAPAAEKVVILSHRTWRERYAADPAAIGRVVRLNGQPYTIVGVMPERFTFAQLGDLWIPLTIDPLSVPRGEGQLIGSFGRLKPGVSVAQATADLAAISRRLAADHKENVGYSGFAARFVDAYLAPPPKMLLRVMLGAVFFVLLVACANVANLLLDRAVHRTREVGLRIALGATRAAIGRQFLVESLLLSAVATVGAVGIAYVGVRIFVRSIGETVPFWMSFRLHPAVLVFTGAVALLTTLIAGAIPAWQSSRADINEVLKGDSRTASSFKIGRISNALVMFEIALSCALLVPAGLMVKSVIRASTFDPGYATTEVFTARIGFPAFYTDTLAEWRFFDEMLTRVAAIPGVQAAALATGLPATRSGFGGTRIGLEGKTYEKPEARPPVRLVSVSPRFFAALNTPLLAGRDFTAADREGSLPVAIVSRSLVRQFIPKGDPIGQRLQLGEGDQPGGGGLTWVTIVGVSGDMFVDHRDPTAPIVFRPFAQTRSTFVSLVARTGRGTTPMGITPRVREVVRALDADLPLYWVQSMAEATRQALWFVRVFGTLFMIFGGAALFLAAVGLYAVMSFSVSRRTRELGIRMALGATAAMLVGMTFRRGVVRLAIGMALGLLLAFGVSRLVRFILFQVQPSDPAVFGGVAALLVGIGMVACLIPARRATLVEPVVALRRE